MVFNVIILSGIIVYSIHYIVSCTLWCIRVMQGAAAATRAEGRRHMALGTKSMLQVIPVVRVLVNSGLYMKTFRM